MNRKILAILVIAAILVESCTQNNKNILNIKGSDTVLPLTQAAIEVYNKLDSSTAIAVTGGGSGVGIAAMVNGTTDIAQSSREVKMDEKLKLEAEGKTLKEVIIAYDALSIIVHPENKISELTREQIEGIFTGEIKNWKEVGGEDLSILPYSRETSSGTYEFFKESVLNNKNYMNGIMSMPATGGIIQSVSQTKGAISYAGFAYINEKVKCIQVSYDQGKIYVEPTVENVKNKTYPIVRPLYYYYVDINESGKQFIDFILSDKGQQIVNKVGYITIK